MSMTQSTEAFETELFEMARRLLPVDGLRFNIYVPKAHLHQDVSANDSEADAAEDYQSNYWHLDPMHPSNFEDTDTVVITNSMLMSDSAWQKTEIFKKFLKPIGYFHNADVFFRQEDRIIGVLTLVRKDSTKHFTDQEVALLKKVQPFIQYTLLNVYLSERVHDRQSMSDEYNLTTRELDVVELALTGASNKILVEKLNISLPTLRTHLQNVYSKVGVHSNSELISTLLHILK